MKATIIKYKTKNQIFNDFISLVKEALNTFSIKDWDVRQLNQIFKINVLSPSVYISITNQRQYGTQGRRKKETETGGETTNCVKQEVTIRFSASRRELVQDTLGTYSGLDILEFVKTYLQSEAGIELLKDLGYAQYRASDISPQNFLNDSDNFQFLPYFDCTFLYTNSWNNTVGEITKIKEKGIYKI
jgi:hypothetical protein